MHQLAFPPSSVAGELLNRCQRMRERNRYLFYITLLLCVGFFAIILFRPEAVSHVAPLMFGVVGYWFGAGREDSGHGGRRSGGGEGGDPTA